MNEFYRQNLLGEHAELYCRVGAFQRKYKAYRNHPQTLRFENRIEQLYFMHGQQVAEMEKQVTNITLHCQIALNPIVTQKTSIAVITRT